MYSIIWIKNYVQNRQIYLHVCTLTFLKMQAAFWGGVEVSGPTGPLLLV